jgi:hypothetical protein
MLQNAYLLERAGRQVERERVAEARQLNLRHVLGRLRKQAR